MTSKSVINPDVKGTQTSTTKAGLTWKASTDNAKIHEITVNDLYTVDSFWQYEVEVEITIGDKAFTCRATA